MIVAVGYFLDTYYDMGYATIAGATILSFFMSFTSYFYADKLALWSTGAQPLSKEDNPYVYKIVENLCITMGIPAPKIHIIISPALNAFATGRNPKHASIALTIGIINALENEELEGVIAHELSHIRNYDILVMTVVVVLVGAISLLGHMFNRAQWLGLGGRRNDREQNQAGAILMLIGLVFIILSPIIAQLIKLAISRKREYLADASGALTTRYPEGLALALEKISQSREPLRTASAATAHLFIENPFKSTLFSTLFSTHPPVEERIKRLRGT